MKILIDGDSVAITADDFTNLYDCEVVWTDIDPSALEGLAKRDESLYEPPAKEIARKILSMEADLHSKTRPAANETVGFGPKIRAVSFACKERRNYCARNSANLARAYLELLAERPKQSLGDS